jgi:excisionase family DNA binding protein
MTILEQQNQREGLSIVEACQVAGIGRTKLYEAISDGSLPARKYGKRTIILRADLQSFLNALPVVTPAGQ